jgi:hypothetical protein
MLLRSNRPVKTTADLIALINRHYEDWWPAHVGIVITRTAEHDWIAIAEGADQPFLISLARTAADLSARYAWAGR